MADGIDCNTDLALYADDTKIWRKIRNEKDHIKLQADINYLLMWSIRNKINFNFDKCKVLSINNKSSPLSMLPFATFFYYLGDKMLPFVDSETDLGVIISSNFSFNEQCENVLSKANQKYGLLRRTCHFVDDVKRKRNLYLALVRAQFEHCSQIWHPNKIDNKTLVDKFENVQKKCIKWILKEEEYSYHSVEMYNTKCKEANLLPMIHRFNLNDLVLFHKVFHRRIPVKMPPYLSLFTGNQLRSSHLDNLCFVSSVLPRGSSTATLNKSFFYRTHNLWNRLPLEIRQIVSPIEFRREVIEHFWELVSNDNGSDSIDDSMDDSIT